MWYILWERVPFRYGTFCTIIVPERKMEESCETTRSLEVYQSRQQTPPFSLRNYLLSTYAYSLERAKRCTYGRGRLTNSGSVLFFIASFRYKKKTPFCIVAKTSTRAVEVETLSTVLLLDTCYLDLVFTVLRSNEEKRRRRCIIAVFDGKIVNSLHR
jgi:hypothetical protein